ncbi:hypothetical protein DQ04_00191120 [Trypanosoma grayi]|uniref:hypothetical protein n=1 Tax=Trypanosoma grayi TaxID=71804 RepID=UPI0004F41BF4|nr:hypothetical protein DQ04_00191120 [Trypanosoma grayi]KEG15088.1 hypothetical protein DQ04_00191120 [Trypanosoma grayi]
MIITTNDVRSDFHRRLRGVMRTIDETLAVDSRRAHTNSLPRARSNSPERRNSFSLVPHLPSWTERRSEQRRHELQAEREDAQRLLDSLRYAREKREPLRDETTANRLSGPDVSVGPLCPSCSERQCQCEASTPSPMRSPPLLLIPTIDQHQQRNQVEEEEKQCHQQCNNNDVVPTEVSPRMAELEEASRQRLLERRAAEEKRLAMLRELRRSAVLVRQQALAEAEAQIERAESERIARLQQLEEEARCSAAEAQKHCALTVEELRAIEVHGKELAALRAHTGIGNLTSWPVRLPPAAPPHPPAAAAAPLPLPQPPYRTATDPVSSYGESMAVSATRPPSSNRSSSSSTSPPMWRQDSPLEAPEVARAPPRSSRHTISPMDRVPSPNHLLLSPHRRVEDLMPPPSLSSTSSSVVSKSMTTCLDGESQTPRNTHPPGSSYVRRLMSPSISSYKTPVRATSPIMSVSQALAVLQRRGVVTDVLPREGRMIPTLLRLSADRQEVLLQVERLEKLGDPSKVTITNTPPRQRQQQSRQRGQDEGTGGSLARRVREVHHFPLVDSLLLYPFGVLGNDANGVIRGVLCGRSARRWLVKFFCTLFARPESSSYHVFLISRNSTQCTNGDTGRPWRLDAPGAATLLLLQFRSRREWATFLSLTAASTEQVKEGPALTYGRALWMLAAHLWQQRRRSVNPAVEEVPLSSSSLLKPSQATAKHFRRLPDAVLSFSADPKRRRMPVLRASSPEARGRSRGISVASRRFVVPVAHENDVGVGASRSSRSRRFGLRSTVHVVAPSSAPTGSPAALMKYGY